jgi:hypothetical protein
LVLVLILVLVLVLVLAANWLLLAAAAGRSLLLAATGTGTGTGCLLARLFIFPFHMKKKILHSEKLFASACYLVSAIHKLRDQKRKHLIPLHKQPYSSAE